MPSKLLPSRWFQFRLRTLLVLTGLCAITAAWLGSDHRAQQREERAFRAIMNKGGSIYVRPDHASVMFVPILWCPTSDGKSRHLNGSRSRTFCDADLHLLDDIRRLTAVTFERSQVTVEAARQFQRTHPGCHVSHPEFPKPKETIPETIPSDPATPLAEAPTTETKDI